MYEEYFNVVEVLWPSVKQHSCWDYKVAKVQLYLKLFVWHIAYG